MAETNRTPSPALVEEYRRQMMALIPKATPQPPNEENWLDARFPQPDIIRDRQTIPAAAPTEPAPPPPIAETPFIGYLRVFVFTGDKAEPLPGALVTVQKEDTLFANTTTDRDGYTQVIPLPSVNPELTLVPGSTVPYVTYDVTIYADGFRPVRHQNLPVYGNNYVTLPVALLPLLPGENTDQVQDFTSGGPTNL